MTAMIQQFNNVTINNFITVPVTAVVEKKEEVKSQKDWPSLSD
jgi:hypothetical protein